MAEVSERDGLVEVETLVLRRELPGGAFTCQPLAELSRVSHGGRDEALVRLERFLEKHLTTAPARLVARYGFPSGVALESVDVELVRRDLPERLRRPLCVRFPCVVLPQGADAWVILPALDHTFFLARGESLAAVVASEAQRLVQARGAWGQDELLLLPAAREELVPLTVLLAHEGEGLLGRAESARKRKVAEHRRRLALEVLERVAEPLHRSRRGPWRRSRAELVGGAETLERLEALLLTPRRGSVLLVGEEGVGKSAFVEAFCSRHGATRLLFSTSAAQLVAGMSGFGEWQERVTEVARAAEELDAVLYFENLRELLGERPERGGVDVAGVLRPYVVNGRLRLLGELTPDAVDGASRRQPALFAALARVTVTPSTREAARLVLAAHARRWQRDDGPSLENDAQAAILEVTDRYLPYRAFPGKAVRLAEELAATAREGESIGADRAYDAFSAKSGIPGFLLRPDRALSVDELVVRLGERVVGQREAVRRVAETLSVVKARLSPEGRPLSTFLFVGPTGVGKTEVARALSSLLFGSEERMVRFDMSEYTDPFAALRLIRGTPRGGGALTSRVREQPFCLLLLDEIEKAHPSVFDLLLQVLGEGRLTDGEGRTTFFHNAIIILTSNLGAGDDKGPIGLRAAAPDRHARYLRAVEEAFRPELVGRLDRVVVFEPLTEEELEAVTDLAIRRVGERRGLMEHGVALEVTEAARKILAHGGHDVRYGVRALRRHLEAMVVVPISRVLAQKGPEARGALAWVGTSREGSCPTESSRHRIARERVGSLVVELYRRAAAGSRRGLAGGDAVAEGRRRLDVLVDRDEVRGVFDHLELCRAQLATARSRRREDRARPELAGDDIEGLRREQHRVERAVEELEALRADVRVAEQLCLTALFDGEPAEEWAAEATGILGRGHAAVARLLLSPRAERDEVTLALFAPDGPAALREWLTGLVAEAPRRGWLLSFHERSDGPHGESWPSVRPFGPPRDLSWARRELLGGRGRDRVVMRARGREAALWLGLEAGTHRLLGLADNDAARHLEVRLGALRFELDDEAWLHPELLRMPEAPRRGVAVARERHVRGTEVVVHKVRTAPVPAREYWQRIEEIALEHLLFLHDSGAADGILRGVCGRPVGGASEGEA